MVCFTGSQIKPALKGEVDASKASRRRGYIGAALVFVNPSVNPPCGVLPAPRPGSLLVRFTGSQIKPALKGAVDASKASRRRGCIGAVVIYVNPSVNPPCGVLPAPRPGSLLEYYTNFNIKPALKGEVGFAKQKPEGLHRGCSCLRQPLSQTAARRISHGAAIFHIAQAVIVCQTGDIQLMPNVN